MTTSRFKLAAPLEFSTAYSEQIKILDKKILEAIDTKKEQFKNLRAEQNKEIDALENNVNSLGYVVKKEFKECYKKAIEIQKKISKYENSTASKLTLEQLQRFASIKERLLKLNGADERWDQLQKVRNHLVNLSKEKNKYEKNTPAYKDAEELCTRIETLSNQYINGIINLNNFKTSSKQVIDVAKSSSLKDVHSMKEIFANLLLAIASIPTVGLAYLVPALVQKSIFPIKAGPISKINSLKDEITGVKNSEKEEAWEETRNKLQ